MKPPPAGPDSLRVTLQVAARRPWVPGPVAVRKWARAAHAAGLGSLSPRARKDFPAGRADLCALARPHLLDPYLTLRAAVHYGHVDQPFPSPYLAVQPK